MFAAVDTPIKVYHNGSTKTDSYKKKNRREKPPELENRQVIAWDMEGLSLSGQDKPQHPVIFGCSAEIDNALQGRKLKSRDMLSYILDVAERYPHAIHVGFAFKYDANMLIQGFNELQIVQLWKNGSLKFQWDDSHTGLLRIIPGKMFTLSRYPRGKRNTRSKEKVSVTIYDYSSFFGQSFIDTAEKILGDDVSPEDKETIAHGKAARGLQSWQDIAEIRHYWEREILLIQRVFEKFRDVMFRAGFKLKEWYGPGALANFINAQYRIREHMAGAQTTSGAMPEQVHHASKVAFFGGRFELFQAGRIKGPVYVIDINSAYPYALTKIPSLAADAGKWVHEIRPSRIRRFGFYRIRFLEPHAQPVEYRPMPLPFRNKRGLISYPNTVHGWYASPEAMAVQGMAGVEIEEGWYWDSNEEVFPWQFLNEMYDRRMRLGKSNLISMPFKLGPNSLYGKYAQTVGWDKEKFLPPKSHALPVAAWVTSYCRALLWSVIRQDPSNVIAVETDSVFTLSDPKKLGLNIGDGLGQWDYSVYDEIVYMQSGMYHYKKDGEWKGVRSRGLNKGEYQYEAADQYLASLKPGEIWEPMTLETKPRFVGAGAAIASGAPTKSIHCSWRTSERKISLADTGKRIHNAKVCRACQENKKPNEYPHRLFVSSSSDGQVLSFPRALPWESKHSREVTELRNMIERESELITR